MNKLPPDVSVHGNYYTVRYRDGDKRSRKKLCHASSSISKVWRTWEEWKAGNILTISKLISEYQNSHLFNDLAASTQRDYEGAISQLIPVFGNMAPGLLRVTHVQIYMDKRSSKKRANVERTVLINVYKWAATRYDQITDNPAAKAIPFKLKARDRYMTDAEFLAIYNAAPLAVQVAMDLSYMLAARQGDVLNLKWSDVHAEGIYIKQSKTGKSQIKPVNQKDWAAILNKAKNTGGVHSAVYIVSNRSGQGYTSSGFKAMWKKARAKAGITDVTFHDIKAKAISDYEGDKQLFSGHKSRSMMERYNRTPDVVEAARRLKKGKK